jgi:hypothetical protein
MNAFLLWFFVISTHAALCVAAGVLTMLRPEKAPVQVASAEAVQMMHAANLQEVNHGVIGTGSDSDSRRPGQARL